MSVDSKLYTSTATTSFVPCSYNDNAIKAGFEFISEPDIPHLTIDSKSGNGDGMTQLLYTLAYQLTARHEKILVAKAERILSCNLMQQRDMQKLFDVNWLLIDDVNFLLGKQKAFINPIFDMLAARNRTGKKTLYTLAVAADELHTLTPDKQMDFLYSSAQCRLETPALSDKLKIGQFICSQLAFAPDPQTLASIVHESENIRQLENLLNRYNAEQRLKDCQR
jgi:chromosomal replication initiation ATPase DnaA